MWVKRFLLVAALWLFAWPALAQNPTCPTRPLGDDSNACASTAFVQDSAASPSPITSGRPWCDPVGFGAGTGVAATDLAAFNACKAVLATLNGGTIFLPAGYTFCTGGFTMDVGFSRIVGQAQLVPTMSACGANVTPLTVTAPFVTIERIGVQGFNSPTATAPALKISTGAGGFQAKNAYVSFGSRPCELNGANDTVWEDSLCIFGYGDSNHYLANTPGTRIRGGSVDQAWPVSIPTFGATTNAWAPATGYNVGDVVTSGGFYLQARVAGTSGGSNPTLQPYFTDIVDGVGTLRWQLVSNTSSCAIRFDSGASEVHVIGLDMSAATKYNACMSNNTTGGVPNHIVFDASIFSISVDGAFFAEVGYNTVVENSHLRGCVRSTCFGLGVGATYTETLMASNNFLQFTGNGAIVAAGKGVVLDGNYLSNNVNDIQITAAVSGVKAVNNTSGGASTVGLLVGVGAGNKLIAEGNDFSLAGTPVIFGATGNDVILSGVSMNGAGIATTRAGSFFAGSLATSSTNMFVGNAAKDQITVATNYALLQTSGGGTLLNASSGQTIGFRIANTNYFSLAANGGFISDAVTGGSKGANTANIAGVYDSGNRVAVSATTPIVLNATTGDITCPTCALLSAVGNLRYCITAVNFNSANTDNAIVLTLPSGVVRYTMNSIRISHASASISTATMGVFTSTGGGGSTIAATQALTVTTASEDTNNNAMALTLTNGNTQSNTPTTIYARVVNPQGSAATADVCAYIIPHT